MLRCLMVVLGVTATVRGFSSGAPEKACEKFIPLHPGSSTQPLPSPYEISPAVQTVPQGTPLRLMVSSPQRVPFEGFIFQARDPNGFEKPLGTFTGFPSIAQAVNCAPGVQNTITQTNKTKKISLEFEWQPPNDFLGTVIFNGTMLQSFSTYWVGVQSVPVQVVKRSAKDPNIQSAGISTTRRPVTITLPPTLPPEIPELVVKNDPLTEGCGDSRLCFGLPENCVEKGNCQAFVSILVKGDEFEFEMRSLNAAYIALGLSNDAKMGSDSVTECTNDGGKVNIHVSWNNGKSNNRYRSSADSNGIKLLESNYKDGNVYCKFTRDPVTTMNGTQFDLINNKYFLLLAAGDAVLPNNIRIHNIIRGSTGEAMNLAEVGTAAAASKLLLRLHAAFMISAWIGAASIGILLARYFKQTWVGSQLCGKDQWFAWHRMFMLLTWSLTIAGFVLIFVELKAWSSADNPHAILGVVTTALAFIQPFMAALRPAPSSPRRPVFNWLHWFVGNAAHILAIVTIFFATRLSKAEVPVWLDWVLVSFVAFHVIMHLIFSMVGCASEKNNGKRVSTFPMKDMNSSRSPLSPPDRNQDAPHSSLRRGLLGLYIFVILLLTIAIVVIAVLAPIEESYNNFKKIIMPDSA